MSNDPKPVDAEESADEDRDDAVIGVALRRSAMVIIVLALVGGAGWLWAISQRSSPVDKKTELAPPTLRDASAVEIPKLPFTDITDAAGIDFVHQNGAAGQKLLPETMGGGCAFLDYDNDGDQDLLFVNSNRWPWDAKDREQQATMALYRNDGSGRFDDVTAEAGLAVSLYGMGVATGDYDNDGQVDLFISALGTNRLFRNSGGIFVDVTEEAGVAGEDEAWSTSCGWFDFDNDSDLDLLVCNYLSWSKDSDLSQNFQIRGVGRAYGRPQDFPGTYCYLYRNEGDGKFAEISAEAGLRVTNAATKAPMSKSLGVAFADFNVDGLLDVVIANDTVQNFLFRNLGDGKFEEQAAAAGVAFDVDGNARGAMGIDISHFRNSDSLGIAIGNFANEMTALYVSQAYGRAGELPMFSDEAVSNGLGPATRLELTFGLFFFDCDLDGRLDLLAANGHLEDDINKVQSSQHYEQPPRLYWNCGPESPTEFRPVPPEKTGEDLARPMVGRGSSFADIDGDGDLDVVIAATGQRPRLLRNDQQLGHHWLRVKLIGSQSNRDAIGAQVEATVRGAVFRQQVMPTRGYLSQSELPITFGLRAATKVDKLTIRWSSGQATLVTDLNADRSYTFHEEAAVPVIR